MWLVHFINDGLQGSGELTDRQIEDDYLSPDVVKLINKLYGIYGPKDKSN